MSVIETVALPAQPDAGVTNREALGGNGFNAPIGAYFLRNMQAVGDATAGVLRISVTMDPDYCAMVGYATMALAQATPATISVLWTLLGERTPSQSRSNSLAPSSVNISAASINDLWLPPAFVMSGTTGNTLSVAMLNVDTDVLTVSMCIYLFDIRAREAGNYPLLVGARGGV